MWYCSLVSEVSSRQAEIEAVADALGRMWDQHGPEVPAWVAQELTFGQMRLLFLLGKQGPATMSRIAEWLAVGLPAASGVVERIERHGLIQRQHRLDDRRVVECQLTAAGRELIDAIAGMRRSVLRGTLAVFTDDEIAVLAHLLQIVLERTGPGVE